jgi:hypothetical protein
MAQTLRLLRRRSGSRKYFYLMAEIELTCYPLRFDEFDAFYGFTDSLNFSRR